MLCITPEFDSYEANVTSTNGTTAVLPCTINHLSSHQVVWTNPESTIVSLQIRRIIDDVRISVERPYIKDWHLHIRNVRVSDSGEYTCQINTTPVKMKIINLKVVVPPTIISHLSSTDMEVREGDTVTLICNVTGIPHPNVTWYRQSASNDYSTMERIGQQGEVLVIHNVSRYCDDVYECVAKNGIPPVVSRKIKVSVDFAPEVQLRNKRIGQVSGRETILDCRITASPQGVTVWMRNGKELVNNEKYSIEVFNEGGHTITLSLRITQIKASDFGEYTCLASNHLGRDRETMVLYEKRRTTPAPTENRTHKKRPFINYTNTEHLSGGQEDINLDKNIMVTVKNFSNQSFKNDPSHPLAPWSESSGCFSIINDNGLCLKSIGMYIFGIIISSVLSDHSLL
ncbi:limbic system-associated membrane protein isoform X2 [Octopus bimaculoides]|uniref:limbic system-associated membrane protein isoform X2 n=1 Tax=Octopus bimaculoides TaxID=37653 RepID=UPI0022E44102|nr:limbic system-associated membrane protein isoform X2 [Octopus bimaculoides]